MLLFRYIRKAIDSRQSIEVNFADPDVLELADMEKVCAERRRMLQFVRFQKAADGHFLCCFEPMYNVLALAIPHFKDRFSDQKVDYI